MERKADHSVHLVPKLSVNGSVPPLHHMPSCHTRRNLVQVRYPCPRRMKEKRRSATHS